MQPYACLTSNHITHSFIPLSCPVSRDGEKAPQNGGGGRCPWLNEWMVGLLVGGRAGVWKAWPWPGAHLTHSLFGYRNAMDGLGEACFQGNDALNDALGRRGGGVINDKPKRSRK